MAYTTNVPKPANQGGHGSAPTQAANIHAKKTAAEPGMEKVLYSAEPKGFGGSKKA